MTDELPNNELPQPPDEEPRAEAAPAEPEPADATDAGANGVPPETATAAGDGQEDPANGQAKPAGNKHWYVVKVQSGREASIKDAIERRVKIEGLEEYFGQIVIPVEKRTEMRNGKRVVREHKLYPGYLIVEVEYNDRILYLFRETSGVGDFVGGSLTHPPPPMSEQEIQRLVRPAGEPVQGITHGKPRFDRGDRVKVKDGTFAGMEGEVKELLEAKGLVRVELTIFGRPVPVELEYWQVENV